MSRTPTALELQGLTVSYLLKGRWRPAIREISFEVPAGSFVAVVGESGSGKSTIAQAVLGLMADNGRLDSGRIVLAGTDVSRWSERRMDAIRGKVVSLVPQDPTTSLNPVQTIGRQVGEILQVHRTVSQAARRTTVLELLRKVGLHDAKRIADSFPHQLSGGMKQRALIAIAIALRPSLIVADEPTSGLDVTVQKRILDLIDELRAEAGTAVLFITHDLGVAAQRADRIVVLKAGQVQEAGDVAAVLDAPRNAYTRELLQNAPAWASPPARRLRSDDPNQASVGIEVHELAHAYGHGKQRHLAVKELSFAVQRGTTHALVGESGSGKTTVARILAGFIPLREGRVSAVGHDLGALRGERLRRYRRHVQLVHQNPYASLDPRQTVRSIVTEPLLNFPEDGRAGRLTRVEEALRQVGLAPELFDRRPQALSGGQRQRVAIARAIVLRPQVLVLDEAVSALDATVQAQILTLLRQLQDELGLTYLFVSHDLAVVRQVADTITVIRDGVAQEQGEVGRVFDRPRSAYTRELLAAIPRRRHPSTPPSTPTTRSETL